MAFKMNTPKIDLCAYPPYIIMGEPKAGKTSTFRDLVLHNYGDEKYGLLVSFSDEEGYLALDRLQYEKVEKWDSDVDEETGIRGFEQVVDDLVENRKQYGIKVIALDTYDKMVEVAISEVLRQSKRETGKPCKSINEAFGGFGRGRARMTELILEQVGRLRSAGYAIFVLAHTKWKEKTDAISGEKYEQLTNNLNSDYYGVIANIAQMIVNITIEREVVDGKQVGEKRLMYFRNNGLIEAGGRFSDLPECLPLSAANFMKAFEIGVKSSFLTPVNDEKIEEIKQEQDKEIEKHADIMAAKKTKEDAISNEELCAKISAKWTKSTAELQAKAKEVMAEYKISNFKEPSKCSHEGLEKILAVFE